MKVLLINPPLENLLTVGDTAFIGKRGFFPSMGILYVASYCNYHTDHEISVIDASLEGFGYPELTEILKQKEADVIGISVLTFSLYDCVKTTRLAKKLHPEAIIVWGGIHVSLYPEESISHQEVDFAVQGEGEITFCKLLANLNDKKKLMNTPGLLFRENNENINTGARAPIIDLDSLPFPVRKMTPYHKFYSANRKTLATTVIASRGCPFNCLFCPRSYLLSNFRCRSPQNIVEELRESVALNIKEFHFYDDTFTINRNQVMELCQLIREEDLKIEWSIMTRVDMVDSELLKTMKQAGCNRIRYGIESGNDLILKTLRKGITVAQTRYAFKITKNAGIETVAYFIIGSPGERLPQIKESIALAKELNADYTSFSIMTAYPGTELYLRALEKNIINRDCWREYALNPDANFKLPLWKEHFTRKELINIQAEAYRTVYLRPKYLIKKIANITTREGLRDTIHQGLKMIRVCIKPERES